jgi:hypothetical protein
METRMTEQQIPATPTPSAVPTGAEPADPAGNPLPAAKQPPWGKPENFDPDKAWDLIQNLRNEKGVVDPALKSELDQMRQTMQQQRDALAAALGVKPEETSDTDKLAQQIQGLQSQILSAEKRALAVEFKVPEAMLTAPDAAALREQAAQLAEFAQAAHYAALTSTPPPPPPAFQPNPGQGQGNGPLSPEAQAEAEYEKYYPSTKK